MRHLDVDPLGPTESRDLHEATGIPGCHDARARCPDTFRLPPTERIGDAGLEKIVHAGTAAAEVALAKLDEAKSGDPLEEIARLSLDLLAVHQVARVVIGHRRVDRAERQIPLAQHLRDISHLPRERLRGGTR